MKTIKIIMWVIWGVFGLFAVVCIILNWWYILVAALSIELTLTLVYILLVNIFPDERLY
jgi:hypothetical protein